MSNNVTKRGAWLLCATLTALTHAGTSRPVTPVPRLDNKRFAGTWYEVARLPTQSQADCASHVTEHYSPRPDGSFQLTSSCRTASGQVQTMVGCAWTKPSDTSHARLKVSFMPRWLRWLPIRRGESWVVMLDPDYRFAVLSEPSRQNIQVLSRLPSLPAEELGRIVDRLAADGYPTRQLVLTRQSTVVREIGPDLAAPFTGRPRLMV
ncbi:MAG TPA: lipocalin family protein [Burkholderiaceae bacterium]|nr:lipocalin family protein [Burkholderiaceae bacterium]